MARRLEVKKALGDISRLTITPERITIKIAPPHAEMTEVWTRAAETIAAKISISRSLRGRLDPGNSTVWLETGNREPFLYDFSGELRSDGQG